LNSAVRRNPKAFLVMAALAAGGGASRQATARPAVQAATLQKVQEAIRKPGARAVLVNVWATFCEPCREEMPDLLRLYRARQTRGLRLVLVSADDEGGRADVEKALASWGVDFPSYLKTGDDNDFINGLDPRWTGALPASFLFDGQGKLRQFWPGEIKAAAVAPSIDKVLDELVESRQPKGGKQP
jgi:thiol-disulfide isomerase/thioredoxin